MHKGFFVIGIIITIIGIGYYSVSLELVEMPFETQVISNLNSAMEKIPLETESIMDVRNTTISTPQNRTASENIFLKEAKIEQMIHNLINIERENNQLSKLSYNRGLESIAKHHSYDMAIKKFFAHENLDGQNPTDRGADLENYCIKVNGIYITSGIAENIFMINSTLTALHSADKIAKRAVMGWMNSEGHKNNILNPNFESEGIGAIITDSSIHITQNFC